MNKTNIKKPIISLIAIAIMGLMITSAFGLPFNSDRLSNDYTVKITKTNKEPQFLQTITQTKNIQQNALLPKLGTNLAFPGEHPAIGRTASGTIMTAYYESTELQNIVWTFSSDDGATFDPGVYYEVKGDYPAIDQWEGSRFFGTYVTDFSDLNGGPTYIFDTSDPTNYDVYQLRYWDWSSYGWSDMMDADIACDNSQEVWEWGVCSYVTSSTYGDGYTDGPTIVYSDEQTEGSGFISWYYYDNCDHTEVAIDPITHMAYCVYDWEDAGVYKLLVRKIDFSTIETGFDTMYEITGGGNLIKPTVAAYNDKVVILAETDEFGGKDIVCLHTDAGDIENLQTSYVANEGASETNPDVQCNVDGNFIAIYTKSNNLFAKISIDSGSTWTDEKQVNENADVVIDEYKSSDLGDLAVKAMWEEEGVDGAEIWIGDAGAAAGEPPATPVISGPTKVKPGQSREFSFTTTDPDGDQVYYYIDWGDGTTLDWQGPYASGTTYKASHAWDEKAGFTIKCKAKDTKNLESNFGTFDISTPKNSGLILRLFDYIQHLLPNIWEKLGL